MALGEQLRKARLAKKESTSQVAAATRMKVQQIDAMEREDFTKIPAPIYGKGFIKLYAEHVGIDPQPLIDEYMASLVMPRTRSLGTERPRKESPVVGPSPAPSEEKEAKDKRQPVPARRPEREFAEPDLFSRVGAAPPPAAPVPAGSVPPREPPPRDVLLRPPAAMTPPSVPGAPATAGAAAPVKPAAVPAPPRPFVPKPEFLKKEEGKPLKLESPAVPAIDIKGVGNVFRDMGKDVARFFRRGGTIVSRGLGGIGGSLEKVRVDLSPSSLVNSPVKLTVLVVGVVMVLIFVASGLSRFFGSKPGESPGPEKAPKELDLRVDPPAPYFE